GSRTSRPPTSVSCRWVRGCSSRPRKSIPPTTSRSTRILPGIRFACAGFSDGSEIRAGTAPGDVPTRQQGMRKLRAALAVVCAYRLNDLSKLGGYLMNDEKEVSAKASGSGSSPRGLSRRDFIRTGGAAATAFTIVPRHVLGGTGYVAPSEKITLACVG